MINIDIRRLPPSGAKIAGESSEAVQLDPNDPVQPLTPLSYVLDARHTGDFLHLEGTLEATFSLECGRCLTRFPYAVRIPNYVSDIPVENLEIIDLTPGLREDILLDLPGYPRCEIGNVEPHGCPASDAFSSRESSGSPSVADTDKPDKKNVWGALDDIDTNP